MEKHFAIINRIDTIDTEKTQEIIRTAGDIIRNGGTVIFPTETVYGLGANALDSEASKKIYKAKGRPSDNPLIVHISNLDMLNQVAKGISEHAKVLIKKFWAGPLTMIFYKKEIVPSETTGGLETVAVRMPSNLIARNIIEYAGVPIAAPSANISGRPSITTGEYAVEEMSERVDMIILSDDSEIGIESTVVDMTTELPVVLRPGKISQSDIIRAISKDDEDFFKKLEQLELLIDSKNEKAVETKSPGMKYRHYSPDAKVFLLKKDEIVRRLEQLKKTNEKLKENVDKPQNHLCKRELSEGCFKDFIQTELESAKKSQIRVLTKEQNKKFYGEYSVSLGKNADEIAKNMFRLLRKMDEEKVKIIFFEDFNDGSEFISAVMNRIRKAAENID